MVGLCPLLPVQALMLNVTDPVGVIAVPEAEVSVTVTVQVAVFPPLATLVGEQLTDTLTVRRLTVTVAVPELVA